MLIGMDVRYLRPGCVGGTETYVRNLITAFGQADREHDFVLFTNLQNSGSFYPGAAARISESDNWADRMDMDVLFFPGTTMMPVRSKQKSVVTVHDLQHLHLPENFSLRERFRRFRRDRPSALRANAVIAISKFTQDALLTSYGLSEEMVTVIYPGVDRNFFQSASEREVADIRKKFSLPDRFVFYPARFWLHKNHARLYEAMRIVRREAGLNYWLVLTGENARGPLPEMVMSLGFVPSSDLPALYRAADALAFPSLYEGFGLPVLEAMAAGCPVVCSTAGALPEAAGDAAVFVNPASPAAIAAGLQRVLTDLTLRADLVRRGDARAERVSWTRAAGQTLDLIEKVYRG